MTEIHERIKTLVRFESGHVTPIEFIWHKRQYLVSSVNFIHTIFLGKTKLYLFSVRSGENTYVLSYDSSLLVWELCETTND